MKITDVATIKLSYPLKKPLLDGLSPIKSRDGLLVQIQTNEGIVGTGECAAFWVQEAVEAFIQQNLKPCLLGEDPLFVEKLWTKMYKVSFRHGRTGLAIIGISGVDIALWDIVGQVLEAPLYRLFGQDKEKVEAYASAGYYGERKGPKELAEEMKSYVNEGFRAVKMKVGGASPKEDTKRVEAVREAIGEEIELMIDANNAWDINTALRMTKVLEDYNPYFLEEPVSTDNIEGSAKVAASTTIPIAGYETEYTRFGFKRLILKKAVDIVQPDPTWSGGLTECRKIAGMASAWEMPCIPHTYGTAISLVAGLHFVASVSNAVFLELGKDDNPLRDNLLEPPLRIQEGYVLLPDGPGLGIHLNSSVLDKYRI